LAEARGPVRDLLKREGVTERLGNPDPSKSVAAIVAKYELDSQDEAISKQLVKSRLIWAKAYRKRTLMPPDKLN
jgi:hypothetical protein